MTNKTDNESRIASGLEIRAKDDGQGRMITGYAAVFDSRTDIGGFSEVIERGAFKSALENSDIHALYNHSYDALPLGRMKAGTLRVKEDKTGLAVEIDLPDTQFARDLEASMERGDVDQMSFQFSMRGGVEEWDDTQDPPLRTIRSVGELYDVTVCPRGAYPETSCALRSLEKHRKTKNFNAAQLRMKLKGKHLRLLSGEKGDSHGAGADSTSAPKGDLPNG
jgi:HK97 family phage prohead protease